ncbi:hypothetical protein E4T42_08431 [Aureobasidium subglaciale]|nr:hypothetical protein E4T42_08431 [Aureobasidium subglaciale]
MTVYVRGEFEGMHESQAHWSLPLPRVYKESHRNDVPSTVLRVSYKRNIHQSREKQGFRKHGFQIDLSCQRHSR